jgi:hypothetical protein
MTTAAEIKCEWCGQSATLRDKTSDCETRAPHWFGVSIGESLAAGRMLGTAVDVAKLTGASRDEILAAVERALDGGEPLCGPAAREFAARGERYREGGEVESDSRLWVGQYEPLAEVAS